MLVRTISKAQWRKIRQQVNTEQQFTLRDKAISCNNCNKNYCCINQNHIEVCDVEFDNLDFYITEEHKKRAYTEMKRTDGLISCPFNNPENGECEIYKDRFTVCSSQGVTTPVEDCNSTANPNGGTMIADRLEIYDRLSEDSKMYINTIQHAGGFSDIIAQFKRVYGEENPDETKS